MKFAAVFCCWKRPGAFSRTFKALRDAFLLLPPPCEEPELLLPDLSLPSPPWLALGPSRCWPAPRRRPSWRLSLDIELCWMVGRWEKSVHGQRFPVVRVDGKTCQINTWQWGQPNGAGSRLGIRVWLTTGPANYLTVLWNRRAPQPIAYSAMWVNCRVCFLWAGLKAVCHSNHEDRDLVDSSVSQVTRRQQETKVEVSLPSN